MIRKLRTGKEEGTRAFILFVILLCWPMILASICKRIWRKITFWKK